METDLNKAGELGNWLWFNRDVRGNNNHWETGEAKDMDIDPHRDVAKQIPQTAKLLLYLYANRNNGMLTQVQNNWAARWFGDDTSTLQAMAIIAKALRDDPDLFDKASNAEATKNYR
jgi:Cu/Ag efflux pump CusA